MENIDDGPVIPKLDLIVIDCPDALELATFYAKLLSWTLEEGSDQEWATLVPPRGSVSLDEPGGEATLAFQRIDGYVTPTWPVGYVQRGGTPCAEDRLLGFGARVHEHQPSASGSFKVYLDPAGHPFCLVKHSVY